MVNTAVVSRSLVWVALCSLLALIPLKLQAEIFGPAIGRSELLTGHGFDPSAPKDARQSPFISLATRRESNGVQGFQYKLELTTSLTNSTREKFFGAELQARVGLYSTRADIDVSSQKALFRSAFVLNIYAKVDYGTEYLADASSANLNSDALALTNNPAAWIARYGTQVVTRRRRGGLVVGSIVFNTSNATESDSIAASLSAAGSGGTWSASLSTSLVNKVTEAIRSLNGSVSIQGYGGNGFVDLTPPPGSDPTNFQTYVNLINNYLGNINEFNM